MAMLREACYGMVVAVVVALSLMLHIGYAYDPSPLQDFCVGVAEPHNAVLVNGLYCKNPKDVTANDFLYKGFNTVGDTNNALGSKVVQVNVTTFPALNTLGVAMGRVDFAPGGLNAPHYHPRASEMLTVIEGTLYVGFVTSNLMNGANKLYAKVLNKGEIFAFPQGLVHFQLNVGNTPAVANVAFGGQQPGFVSVSGAMFNSYIPDEVLTKGFQVNEQVIKSLRAQYFNENQLGNFGIV